MPDLMFCCYSSSVCTSIVSRAPRRKAYSKMAARRYKIHGYVSLTFSWIYGIMFSFFGLRRLELLGNLEIKKSYISNIAVLQSEENNIDMNGNMCYNTVKE